MAMTPNEQGKAQNRLTNLAPGIPAALLSGTGARVVRLAAESERYFITAEAMGISKANAQATLGYVAERARQVPHQVDVFKAARERLATHPEGLPEWTEEAWLV